MSLFDTLYNATKEALAVTKKPLVEKKVKRGFDAAIDSLENDRLEISNAIDDLRVKIANGDVDEIRALASKVLDMGELEQMIQAITAEKENMFK